MQKRFFNLACLICLMLTACNLPVANNDEDLTNQAATAIALTLEAQSAPPAPENTPLPTPTLAVTSVPAATITPTYSVPMLNVNENTNCRSGPGETFGIQTTVQAGNSVEIIGKDATGKYWVVKVEGLDDPCWIWGEFSTATGSHWTLPTMQPPQPPTPQAANQPTNLNYTYECTFNGVNSDVAVTLTWNDNANDEQSYRVFRDSKLVAELPANSKTYSETVAVDATHKLTYGVAAYSAAGESGRTSVSFSCQ